jgi:hypothetical protein
MTSIKDLERCSYFDIECETLTAIGWLGKDLTFETGPVSEQFFCKLKEISSVPWQPMASAGIHFCEFCQFDAQGFSENVFVPYRGRIYVAPTAIVHYISNHWYRPPQIFVDAVLSCPPMRSIDYYKTVLANGGRSLLA